MGYTHRSLGFIPVFALVLVVAAGARSGAENEFLAMPGLWKTTLWKTTLSNQQADKSKAQVWWHCVDEDADPWISFAQLQMPERESCLRKSYTRTATSLKWRVECSGPSKAINEGSINFDAATHYSGKIHLKGIFMGYPTSDVILVEGTRAAACTSPSD